MALRSLNTAIAIKTQSAAGTFTQPSSSTDTYPCANVRPSIETITGQNPEYLGTIHRPGDIVFGSRASLTFQTVLRSPGGSSPPAAGAFIPGRLFTAAGFTENILSTAVPASAEAGSAGTTTTFTLGAGATGTADLYNGLAISLSDNGSTYLDKLAGIRDYSASKVATFFETLGSAPAANYQIPKQLAYQLSSSPPTETLSISVWMDGVRYDFVDMIPTGMRINVPVASRDATDPPTIEWTLEGNYQAWADEAAPSVTALGNPLPFRDGDMWIGGKALGGSSFSIDLGITAAYPPNPNNASGYEAGLIVETNRSASVALNHNLKSVIDFMALADAQSTMGLWAQWGSAAGSAVMVNVLNARAKYPNPDNGGQILAQTLDLLIDDASKAISVVFMY